MAAATELDRRIQAYVVDHSIGWGLALGAGAVLWFGVGERTPLVVAAAVLVMLAIVGVTLAVLQGASGLTPGKALLGLRTVQVTDGAPIGIVKALTRGLILATAGLPTAGLGMGVLAWTAATDPSHRRRAWHDRVTGSMVVDARQHVRRDESAEPNELVEAPRGLVNLTTLRLGPPPGLLPARAAVTRTATPVTDGPTGRATDPGRWIVRFDTGEEFQVNGRALLGREPRVADGDEAVRHVVRLSSGDLSLSKTHAQLHVASDGALVVTDRGSTNGSLLRRGGMVRELLEGRPATLLEGDLVSFGDREMRVVRDS